jgi:hypothetical protein
VIVGHSLPNVIQGYINSLIHAASAAGREDPAEDGQTS